MGLQSKLITIMNYRWLVKTTSNHIKSKQFKSFLFVFYRKNIEKAVSKQQMEAWQAILGEISRQQRLKHQPLGNKNRFDNCLINYKGFKLNLDKLSHINPQLLQQLLHIFMRIQINYIHAIDYLNEEKHFRLYSILEPKKLYQFKEYYTKMTPQQKLGEKTVLVPTIGKWPKLFNDQMI